jgi:tetratricopeptide (TPR) repeat protein
LHHWHLTQRDPDRAIADYDEAIRRDPQNALALAARGAVFASKHDYDRALASYDEAIRSDPTYAIALIGRARVNLTRGDWSRAATDLGQALQLDSTSQTAAAEAFTARATARYQMSNFAGAIAHCDAALKLNPRHEQALKIRAFAYVADRKASSTGGAASLPDALMVYIARPRRRLRRKM